MQTDLLAIIGEKMPQFSKGQKLIARYMIENYDKAAFMTASKLGLTVGVSESTVVRFASELGYEGYPQLQKALLELIRNKLTSVQRIEVTNDQLGNKDILNRVLNLDIEQIKRTLEETSKEDFDRAIEKILGAKSIYIIGVRSSFAIACFLSFYFNLIFPNVKLINTTSVSEMFEQILKIDEQDVLIGISFPRYSKRTVKALTYAKKSGASVIGITDTMSSPVAQKADHVLLAHSDMTSFVDSLVAPMSIANALIVAVGLKKSAEISATFAKLEHIWDEYDVYEKVEEKEEP